MTKPNDRGRKPFDPSRQNLTQRQYMVVWLIPTAQNYSAVSVSDYRERVLPFVHGARSAG